MPVSLGPPNEIPTSLRTPTTVIDIFVSVLLRPSNVVVVMLSWSPTLANRVPLSQGLATEAPMTASYAEGVVGIEPFAATKVLL